MIINYKCLLLSPVTFVAGLFFLLMINKCENIINICNSYITRLGLLLLKFDLTNFKKSD